MLLKYIWFFSSRYLRWTKALDGVSSFSSYLQDNGCVTITSSLFQGPPGTELSGKRRQSRFTTLGSRVSYGIGFIMRTIHHSLTDW